jgi:hypothetical protein
LGISPLSEKIIEYRNKCKAHLQIMEHISIPLQAYTYQPPGKRDIGRSRRWRETEQYLRPEQEILLIHKVMMMMMMMIKVEIPNFNMHVLICRDTFRS